MGTSRILRQGTTPEARWLTLVLLADLEMSDDRLKPKAITGIVTTDDGWKILKCFCQNANRMPHIFSKVHFTRGLRIRPGYQQMLF